MILTGDVNGGGERPKDRVFTLALRGFVLPRTALPRPYSASQNSTHVNLSHPASRILIFLYYKTYLININILEIIMKFIMSNQTNF